MDSNVLVDDLIVPIDLTKEFPVQLEIIVSKLMCSYIDAVLVWCEYNNLDVEYASDLIKKNPILKARIQE